MEDKKKNDVSQTSMDENTMSEMRNTLDAINKRLNPIEEKIH